MAAAVGGALASTFLDDMPLWWSVRTAVVVFVVLIGASTVLAWWRSRRSEQ
ncbi:hypothetical protein [Streptomyces sp. NPDC086182]|uniref:hypothetical protein n=1 Tax=Streptomyces sp. NPDC086182 TaxID=3155058 RepID=UPI00342350C6